MSRHKGRKSTPWSDKPRKVKRDGIISLKNKIKRAAPWLGGLFWSHDAIEKNAWVDVYFLSADGRTIYNATLDTATYDFHQRAFSKACETASSMKPLFDDPKCRDLDLLFNPTPEQAEAREKAEAAVYDGLTRYKWIDRKRNEIIESGSEPSFEEIRLDRDYGFGVGLMATINIPFLDVVGIHQFIQGFLDGGELPFLSDRPLIWTKEEMKGCQGPMANSICPNEEWSQPTFALLLQAKNETEALQQGLLERPAAAGTASV